MDDYPKKTTSEMPEDEEAEGMSHSLAVVGRRPGTLHQFDTSLQLLTCLSSNHVPKTHPIRARSIWHSPTCTWQITDTHSRQKYATRELAASSVKCPSASFRGAARRRRRRRCCRRSPQASPLVARCQRPARSGRGPCPLLRQQSGSLHRRTGP